MTGYIHGHKTQILYADGHAAGSLIAKTSAYGFLPAVACPTVDGIGTSVYLYE